MDLPRSKCELVYTVLRAAADRGCGLQDVYYPIKMTYLDDHSRPLDHLLGPTSRHMLDLSDLQTYTVIFHSSLSPGYQCISSDSAHSGFLNMLKGWELLFPLEFAVYYRDLMYK